MAGRPSKFKPEFIAQAEKLCRLGATDMELADFFEVEVRTLYRWKSENEQFCQALKSGKDEADDRVERSLYARANGYEHDEVDIRVAGRHRANANSQVLPARHHGGNLLAEEPACGRVARNESCRADRRRRRARPE